MAEFVRLEVDEGVATIRLDRPKMNALNSQVQEEIRAAATEASERDDIVAVVLYGGERVFAAGADIKEMADLSYVDMVKRSGALQSSFSSVAAIPKPVVAAITGYALGGGCELALCADLRFAAEDAVVGQPEILLGIIPGAGGTQRLTRLVGPADRRNFVAGVRGLERIEERDLADAGLDRGLFEGDISGKNPVREDRGIVANRCQDRVGRQDHVGHGREENGDRARADP
jgi:enoyl-CoA hydratase/carnithine racemase